MSVIERLRKRRCHEVEIDGESVKVTCITTGLIQQLRSSDDGMWTSGAVIGCGLLDDSGQRIFTQTEGESLEQFGDRVLLELDMPLPTVKLLVEAIQLVSREGNAESLRKN